MIALICIAVVLLLLIVWFCIPYSPLKTDFENDVEVLKTENQLYADGEVFTAADFEDFPIAIQKYDGDFVYFDGTISDITYE